MTIEPFSGGYARISLYLEPYDDGPVVDIELYDYLESAVCDGAGGPVTVRVGLGPGPHFEVEGEAGVPPDVLAVPEDWLAALPVEEAHAKHDVFVMRPAVRSVLSGVSGPSIA